MGVLRHPRGQVGIALERAAGRQEAHGRQAGRQTSGQGYRKLGKQAERRGQLNNKGQWTD